MTNERREGARNNEICQELLKFYESILGSLEKIYREIAWNRISSKNVRNEVEVLLGYRNQHSKHTESNVCLKTLVEDLETCNFDEFLEHLRRLSGKIFEVHGKGKGQYFGLSYEALYIFEYQLQAIKEIRDHLIHAFNVYLLGLISNLYLFAHKSAPKFAIYTENCSLKKIPLILPLEFSWLLSAMLHDVGYVYQKHELLKKALPYFYEFIDISNPGTLFPILEPVFNMYGKIISENAKIAYNVYIDNPIMKAYLVKTFEQRIKNVFVNSLVTRQDVHGAISSYITLKIVFKENPFSKNYYWPLIYYEPIIVGAFAQFYHSLVHATEKPSSIPILPTKGSNKPTINRISGYCYLLLLLLIFDEVVDFGRPTKGKNRSYWNLNDINFKDNYIEFTVKDCSENTDNKCYRPKKRFFDVIRSKLSNIGLSIRDDEVIRVILSGMPFLREYYWCNNSPNTIIEIHIIKSSQETSIRFMLNDP